MSSRPAPLSRQPRYHGPDGARAPERRPAPGHAPIRQPSRAYAIVHHGKQVRFGPVVFWIVTGSIILMGAWSAATATYFAFRDDVLTRLIGRQAEMQYAYEDRIAELRARIDRTASRQLLDQEQYDQKLTQIMRRQAMLEARAAALGTIADPVVTGSIKTPRASALRETVAPPVPKPSPISDTVTFTAPPDREARLESRQPAMAATSQFAQGPGPGTMLARLHNALNNLERHQIATLSSVEETYDARARRMRGLFSDLGLNMAKMQEAAPRAGIGGPFVPVRPPTASAGPFERQLYRVALTRAQIDKMTRKLALVPYHKPVVGKVEFSSGFGVRNDPFLGRPAMHTGLDFRAATGDPVRATANGKVVSAGWAGGYGQMVEISHGNGLTTRYGHLSKIGVKAGDTIVTGQVIGAVGSTGRSTGPHLHYETRVNGEAVDPQKFLRAGIRFAQG